MSYKDHCIIYVDNGPPRWLYLKGDKAPGILTDNQIIDLIHTLEPLQQIINELLASQIDNGKCYWSVSDLAHVINHHYYKISLEDVQAILDKHKYLTKEISGITSYTRKENI